MSLIGQRPTLSMRSIMLRNALMWTGLIFFFGIETQFGTDGWRNTTCVRVVFRNFIANCVAVISRSAVIQSPPGLLRSASTRLLCAMSDVPYSTVVVRFPTIAHHRTASRRDTHPTWCDQRLRQG